MKLRPATPADTPFLRRLHHRVYRDVVTRQFGSWDERAQDGWFEQGLAEAEFSVIEASGEPIGTIALKDSSDRIELVELQILPEHQSRGLGSALLRRQIERAQSSRRPITLRVLLENRARALYERHGFVVGGRTDTHYLMEWSLCQDHTPPKVSP
jgi:ribosomal protein S18 acetylase RimI-like enzyme